jgi:hypothetical protein
VAKITADTVAVLTAAIRKLRADFPDAWRPHVEPAVRAWVAEYMPQIPRPHIHVRVLVDADTGRLRAKVTISMRPDFADIQISQDTGLL